jgi:rare lipoprotein A
MDIKVIKAAAAPVAGMAAIFSMLLLLAGAIPLASAETSQDLSRSIERDRQDLERAKAEIADLDRRISTSEQYLNERRLELADATSRLRSAEDTYKATLEMYEGRISAIYKLGDPNFYGVILSSDGFSDAVSRSSYLSMISENDQKLVMRVKAEEEYVREMRARVDELKQAQAEDVGTLRERRQQLSAQVSTGQTRIDTRMAELVKAQQREQQEEALRQAQESYSFDGGDVSGGVMMPSVVVSNEPPAGLRASGVAFSGMASWYGPGFQGNRTANGETYNMYSYTAAHKSLPFNTWLKVTHNGRSVFVRINDRGPYVGGRVLDLSYSSAQAIGISGVGFVSAEIYR